MTGQSLAAIRLLCFLPKSSPISSRNQRQGISLPREVNEFYSVVFRGDGESDQSPRAWGSRGMEAVGEVVAVGPGLTGRKVGDIVAYAGHPMGSYAEEQILPASKAIPVPPLY